MTVSLIGHRVAKVSQQTYWQPDESNLIGEAQKTAWLSPLDNFVAFCFEKTGIPERRGRDMSVTNSNTGCAKHAN